MLFKYLCFPTPPLILKFPLSYIFSTLFYLDTGLTVNISKFSHDKVLFNFLNLRVVNSTTCKTLQTDNGVFGVTNFLSFGSFTNISLSRTERDNVTVI